LPPNEIGRKPDTAGSNENRPLLISGSGVRNPDGVPPPHHTRLNKCFGHAGRRPLGSAGRLPAAQSSNRSPSAASNTQGDFTPTLSIEFGAGPGSRLLSQQLLSARGSSRAPPAAGIRRTTSTSASRADCPRSSKSSSCYQFPQRETLASGKVPRRNRSRTPIPAALVLACASSLGPTTTRGTRAPIRRRGFRMAPR